MDRCFQNGNRIQIFHDIYVPELMKSLFSTVTYILHDQCSVLSEKSSMSINFPTFSITAQVCQDIRIIATSTINSSQPICFVTYLPPPLFTVVKRILVHTESQNLGLLSTPTMGLPFCTLQT